MATLQLPIMTLQDSLYRSPKRKREDDPAGPRLLTSGFHHNFESLLGDRHDTQSPSTHVAGKLQRLGLQSPTERSNLHRVSTLTHDAFQNSTPHQPHIQNISTVDSLSGEQQPTEKVATTPPSCSFTFEMPSTLLAWQDRRSGQSSLSSSPSDDISDRFWQESEITGYSPENPDEDDYGVNGVGYQKTPAIAYAISQKRKQQIAEYRSRETREARQRRGQRRLNARVSRSPQPTNHDGEASKSARKATRVVHFADV